MVFPDNKGEEERQYKNIDCMESIFYSNSVP